MKRLLRRAPLTALPLLLGGALVVGACDNVISPTAPPPPAEIAAPAPADASQVTWTSGSRKGKATEFMLRARGEISGFLGSPLLGTAWVHVTGPPRTAEVTSVVIPPGPGPDGIPVLWTFSFPNGDSFEATGLVELDYQGPPGPPPPGVYDFSSTLTVVAGGGAFAGMTGDLEVRKGVLILEAVPGGPPFEEGEFHLKGRVRFGA